ncbi:hypothetical protein CSA56_04620 [candidate division KSB3 bacterium]|uniref:Uncharacterized protein n=1 Tax=candidate division KSB3 bacterium TaxID=2044937 RepID=A0A2G6KI49_9BACT|nr:MAG: hypothetical protein CSA56_04620 [candidate division KSB3 bacterium]
MMRFTGLHSVTCAMLREDEELWKPLTVAKISKHMADLLGQYFAYTAAGHVLNKVFQLPPLQDHAIRLVAFEAETREFFLTESSNMVYVCQ